MKGDVDMPFKKIDVKELLEKELEDVALKSNYNQIKKEYELIEQIVKIRKQKKISQVDLAKKARVSQQAISRLEREKHIPKIDTLMKIVDGLGLKLTLTER
jgi:DNA-binding XRE family transcriptional regulator